MIQKTKLIGTSAESAATCLENRLPMAILLVLLQENWVLSLVLLATGAGDTEGSSARLERKCTGVRRAMHPLSPAEASSQMPTSCGSRGKGLRTSGCPETATPAYGLAGLAGLAG